MFSGTKKKNPDMRFLFLSKVPLNETPPPNHIERAPRLQGLFYISLKFLLKNSLNKEFVFLLSRP